ncbi:MAG: hypothetical protein IT479_09170 [Xanthomonadales bacterium]|nr:hypothetical protein [Xanthomonadales bacterium]MCC6593434.1 hypothetical protein [Xanthomonadales bacterium]
MTQARFLLVPANVHDVHYCVSRCVRRAWPCEQGPLTGADHEQFMAAFALATYDVHT